MPSGRTFRRPDSAHGDEIQEIEEVNNAVNTAVAPTTDLELYGKPEMWAYPSNAKGDCEDYVLLKRRTLIERGFSRERPSDHRRSRRE